MTETDGLLPVGGYVLAGGRSSRMGQDKALLQIAGRPLIAHAASKLRRFCADVSILSSVAALSSFGPLVADLHPGCGPLSGIEAALAHSSHDWNLILPVDVPFLPTAMLHLWARATLRHGEQAGTRVSMYQVNGVNQPALLMIHRDIAPYLTVSLARGEYKVGAALHAAADDLAEKRGLWNAAVFRIWAWTQESRLTIENAELNPSEAWRIPSDAQQAARDLWFANLNTPEDFAEAQKHLDALDT